MLLHIDHNKTLGDLSDKFNECYPFLQLRFQKKNHKKVSWSDEDMFFQPQTKLEDVSHGIRPGVIEVKTSHKISEFISDLKKQYNLYGRVAFINQDNWKLIGVNDEHTIQEYLEKYSENLSAGKSDPTDEAGEEEVRLSI